MHEKQVEMLESNKKKIQALEGKVAHLEQCIEDLDTNYDKIYKFMLEKSEVVRRY